MIEAAETYGVEIGKYLRVKPVQGNLIFSKSEGAAFGFAEDECGGGGQCARNWWRVWVAEECGWLVVLSSEYRRSVIRLSHWKTSKPLESHACFAWWDQSNIIQWMREVLEGRRAWWTNLQRVAVQSSDVHGSPSRGRQLVTPIDDPNAN